MNLRPYQQNAITAVHATMAAGTRRVALVLPTGAGKTRTAAEIARRAVVRGKRVLFLAHRSELIDQAADALRGFGLTVGAVSASARTAPNPYAPVQVASVQTLNARDMRPKADLIICDEAHHFCADSFYELLAAYPNAHVLGLTATPERGDGRGLGNVFGALVVGTTIRELTEAGYLVPCEVIAPSRPLRPGEIAQRPVDAYQAHAAGRSALVFSPSLIMAELHAEEFRNAGIDARVVEGTTPRGERVQSLEAFRTGRLRVLVNVAVLTEGTDLPIASAAILARGCGTPGLLLQIVGRVLRPHASKQQAVFIDLRGVTHTHGDPAEDREYSLDGRGIRQKGDEGSTQTFCQTCGAPKDPGTACGECGMEATTAKPLVITGEKLHKYQAALKSGPERRAMNLANWLDEAAKRGFKPGWAMNKYKSVYQEWPPRDISALAMAKRVFRKAA